MSDVSTFQEPSDSLISKCMRLQDCGSCLSSSSCSWCPVVCFPPLAHLPTPSLLTIYISKTSFCVPNTSPIPILAPFTNPSICPLAHGRERWELRTRPLGCNCSTITFLTSVISVIATLTAILLLILATWVGKWGLRRWRGRGKGWWRIWSKDWWASEGGWFKWSWRWKLTHRKGDERRDGQDGEASEQNPLLG
jgi:hypothetical protein